MLRVTKYRMIGRRTDGIDTNEYNDLTAVALFPPAFLSHDLAWADMLLFLLYCCLDGTDTYDHRSVRTGHPVRSAIHKH